MCDLVLYNIIIILVTENSVTNQMFADVKEAIKEIHSQWYSLAIELDIGYETRKVRLLIPSLIIKYLCSYCIRIIRCMIYNHK